MDGVTIRLITDVPTLRQVEALQLQVWGMPDRDVLPVHQLVAATSAGGAVLGAFDRVGTLVGFCYGFVGLRDGRPLFYSHMAAVLEEARGGGVGFQLKRAQRQVALSRGLDRMVWTFDPLQGRNAYFNLCKLGVTTRRYHVNYYGDMPDELNRGLESDRLEADWDLRSPRVAARMEAGHGQWPGRLQMGDPHEHSPGESMQAGDEQSPADREWAGAPAVVDASRTDPLQAPTDPHLDLDAPEVRLAVPMDLSLLRDRDVRLVHEWRAVTRRAFQTYLGRGYAATDFVRGETVGHYVLRRDHED